MLSHRVLPSTSLLAVIALAGSIFTSLLSVLGILFAWLERKCVPALQKTDALLDADMEVEMDHVTNEYARASDDSFMDSAIIKSEVRTRE